MEFALVTGGAGFMGSHLVDRLVKDGVRVRIIDNFSTGMWENIKYLKNNPNVNIMIGDLKKFDDCMKTVKDVETVFHFAANPEVRLSTIHPKIHFDENIMATFNLLEVIRQSGNRIKLVFASSSSVYGEPDLIPVDENSPQRPVSIYGASKASCENLIHAYSKLYGLRTLALRYANVVGPRLKHGVVYDFTVKLMRNPHKLDVLGDGTQIRSFIYIEDSVDATMLAYSNITKNFNVYNVASEDWITVKDVANIVAETLGLRNVKHVYKTVMQGVGWPGDVKRVALKISKLRKIGFRPKYSSREAVQKTVYASASESLKLY